jgi:Mg2+ and Co2+ transporter CorA
MIPKEKLNALNNLIKSGENDLQKLIFAVADALNEMHGILASHDETFDEVAEIIGDVEESVYELEDEVFGDEHRDSGGYEDYDGNIYDISCADCGQTITVDYDALDEGCVTCPGCGEEIEFTLEIDDEEV